MLRDRRSSLRAVQKHACLGWLVNDRGVGVDVEKQVSSKHTYSCVVQNIEYFFGQSEHFFFNSLMDVWNYSDTADPGV